MARAWLPLTVVLGAFALLALRFLWWLVLGCWAWEFLLVLRLVLRLVLALQRQQPELALAVGLHCSGLNRSPEFPQE